MQLIHDHLHHWDATRLEICLLVDRLTLAKRRWRGIAENRVEFGFDLEHHLHDGDVFFESETNIFRIAQTPEPVLVVDLGNDGPTAARLGWMVGNLHFQIGIYGSSMLVADDPALRQLFEREHIAFALDSKIFHPFSGGHHH